MKRVAGVLGVLGVTILLAVVISAQGRYRGRQDVYFGYLLGSPRLAGVAMDLSVADASGQRTLRAYVCDGLGVPTGIAVWFKGTLPADLADTVLPLSLVSAGGRERLTITALSEGRVLGVFTEATGATAQFAAYPAIDGAGIYQVTLDANLHYSGVSTDGATLDAQADLTGRTVGTIKPAQGRAIGFTVNSLALASPAALSAHGLSEDYLDYAAFNQIPGSYVAVIAPGGSHWFGRSGAVQLGSPGVFIIGLDKEGR